ncbi:MULTISPECIES: ABC transporter ATP-binding protein [Ralstonia]|uniref:ABC transporter ATP-binding protein n=1 Tax=Ralstonia TaxID=48736 RepID=UPI0005D9D803|nr:MULTISPECIES: ABC transporter ATP-binding protein [Ralstonia]AJW45330.1 mannosyltransferase [Ralstonia mannitolilytica]MBU9579317.1 ABC transporter ATP-binding protein [Ralstonia mannitolilytica]PLT19233.1 ABC transporter ATP-binding protein [Ralstonia mannitolilytica]QIF07537.1 ABC transporter ATP-binding protein [Ralstonia mannitolilytica]CAJ0724288.1 High-affinity branched-chain amino acid transport ATP-binding protein LivF [Ralstonia mannitolilytica]
MATNTPMLEVRGLHAYYGKSHILHGVDMHVGEGEIVALLGRNGVGRSTLAKSIMGMVRHEGEILLRGKNVSGLRTFEVAHQGIGYVPENRDIFPTLTVRQNLLLGEKRNPNSPKPRWQIDDMYQMFPRLKERENTAAGVLSGGEQQMLTLCRTLMGDPDFIIIDEPTEGLAPLIVTLVGEYLKTLKERGISVLLVEQKLAIALDISQRVYVMGHGQIVFEGTPAQLKADAKVRQEWLEV